MGTKILGLFVVIGCLFVVFYFETKGAETSGFRVFHWPAMILTGAGPLGLVLLSTEWEKLSFSMNVLFTRAPSKMLSEQEKEADVLQELIHGFYIQGPRSLSEVNKTYLSPAAQKTFDRLIIRMPIKDAQDFLEKEKDRAILKLSQAVEVMGLAVRLTPSVGMLGTILGMVQLLSSLKDPSMIGSHMSLALLTTFYGLFFSLVLWTPLHHRLEAVKEAELHGYDQVLRWLDLLEKRKPAQYFSDEFELNTPEPSKRETKAEGKA